MRLMLLFIIVLGTLRAEELSIHVIAIYNADAEEIHLIEPEHSFKVLCIIKGGAAPFTIQARNKILGQTNKRTIRMSKTAEATNGQYSFPVTVSDNNNDTASINVNYSVGEHQENDIEEDPDEEASNDLGALLLSEDDDDDWGDEEDEEEDVVDPYLQSNRTLYPWTENQSRSIMNTMLPSAVAIGDNNWYYRILHVARERIDDEPATSFIGLDDNVKIGFQISYGLSENLDLNFQRTNGRSLQVNLSRPDPTKMDYYDFIFRYQFMKQRENSFCDAAVHFGPTIMMRNTGAPEQSINAAVVFEKNILNDRLRLGAGLAYASLSTYERTVGKGPDTKLTPDEYDALLTAGSPVPAEEDEHTLAIPLLAKYALTKKQQLFAEVIVPIDGYETTAGPSIAAGYRLNGNTHEYSIYLSNTGNPSYNGTITGGHDYDEINLFGFFISAFF